MEPTGRRLRRSSMIVARFTKSWAVTLLAVAALAGLAGCSGQPDGTGPPRPPGGGGALAVRLVAFDSCEQALQDLKTAAMRYVGPFGLPGGGGIPVPLAATDLAGRPAAPGAAAESLGAGPAAPDHSTTNTHEAGVDEPDLVKSDGRRLVVVADNYLRVIDVAGRRETGRLQLPGAGAGQLLVEGDRALVVLPWQHARPTANGKVRPDSAVSAGGADQGDVATSPSPAVDGSRLVLIDLTGDPKIVGTLDVDAGYVDARQVNGIARIVVRSWPRLTFVYPDGERSAAQAARENRRVVERSAIDDWLPRYELEQGGARHDGALVDCDQLSHPERYSGSSMLTVLTIPLREPLGTGDAVSVVADGETVYGTTKSLYIAHSRWFDAVPLPAGDLPAPGRPSVAPQEQTTEVHQFDISGPARPRYVASGEVAGRLLNQYSLSEYADHLRVATTTTGRQAVEGPGKVGNAEGAPSEGAGSAGSVGSAPSLGSAPSMENAESAVSVLTRHGERLVQVGRVGGLGQNEEIYAVRFLGPVGYVVTFRRTDPLYTLDLSDPRRPKVAGELKITGYSAYLHPVGDGRLIGVGQEATEQGSSEGTQVSLFDVSDPAHPRRLAQHHVIGGWSEAESDPHAFLFWPATGLTVLPIAQGTDPGALVLEQRDAGFAELGTVRHPDAGYEGRGAVRRALVVGDDLWTVSTAGVMVSDAKRLTQRAWIPFE